MLMLHAGANPVDYDALRQLPIPDATSTHVPIPHHSVVDMVKYSLGFFGHEIVGEDYGVTPDGARFFGVLSLKSTTAITPTPSACVTVTTSISRSASRSAAASSYVTISPSTAITSSSASTRRVPSVIFPALWLKSSNPCGINGSIRLRPSRLTAAQGSLSTTWIRRSCRCTAQASST
jgi:hypothetical protein